MEGNCSEGLGDYFFEQILAVPSPYTSGTEAAAEAEYGNGRTPGVGGDVDPMPMLSTSGGGGLRESLGIGVGMPLGLNLEQGFLRHQHSSGGDCGSRQLRPNNNNTTSSSSTATSGIIQERGSMHMAGLFSSLGQLHTHAHAHSHSVRPTVPSPAPPPQLHQNQAFHSQAQTPVPSVPQAPGIRPRVRARRGQATDPHSIAERMRRERIAERMKALQELVPSANKTDKAAMLDEVVDYVKFLRLQVKVLSMSRLGGAGAVAQLVADVPLSASEGENIEGGSNQQAWDKWSNDGTEQRVAKLMEEDVGAAMQFLQSKALCVMPVSLASDIFYTPQSEAPTLITSESNNHS